MGSKRAGSAQGEAQKISVAAVEGDGGGKYLTRLFNNFDRIPFRIVNLKIMNALPILLDRPSLDATLHQHFLNSVNFFCE